MRRLVVAVSLLLMPALGTAAEAKCQVCVDSVTAERTTGSGLSLRFTARAVDAPALPETGTAVVMQVDGNRSKCINVSLRKIDDSGGVATYVGSLTSFYGNTGITGRVDIGGDIHEFSATYDGKPGTLQPAAGTIAATARPSVPVSITPDPVPATAAPEVVAATAAPQTAGAVRTPSPAEQPAVWLGAVVIVATLAGAFVDRRRALARTTAS